ncbi:hypothetical protein CCP4SC76_1240010 [Gammaproteobacteria bacterium]
MPCEKIGQPVFSTMLPPVSAAFVKVRFACHGIQTKIAIVERSPTPHQQYPYELRLTVSSTSRQFPGYQWQSALRIFVNRVNSGYHALLSKYYYS